MGQINIPKYSPYRSERWIFYENWWNVDSQTRYGLKLTLSPYTRFWFSILAQLGELIASSRSTRVLRMKGPIIWKSSRIFTMMPTSRTWQLLRIALWKNPSTMARGETLPLRYIII